MANSDAARGLIPRMKADGSMVGASNLYYMPSSDGTAAYVGGLVKLAGSGDARGVPSVTANISTGDVVVGVITGFKPDTRDSNVYRAASVERYVYVCDDPDVLFECQSDGTFAAADIGEVADLTGFTSGSTTTGYSSIEVDASTSTASGDGTEDAEIVRMVDRDDNEIGEFANLLVRLNNHVRRTDSNTGS